MKPEDCPGFADRPESFPEGRSGSDIPKDAGVAGSEGGFVARIGTVKRPHRLRWLLACLVSLMALPVCWIAVSEIHHEVACRRVRQRQSERTLRIAALWTERPSLLGESTAGDAWDDYLPAIDALSAIPGISSVWRRGGDHGDRIPAAPAWWHPDREPAVQSAIAWLKKGAARRSAGAAPEIKRRRGPVLTGSVQLALLVLAADANSRRLRGDLEGAAENLMAAVQLALDATSPPCYVGGTAETMLRHMDSIMEELGELILDPRVDPSLLDRIAVSLHVGESQITLVADEADAAAQEFVDREYAAASARGLEMPWNTVARWLSEGSDPWSRFQEEERVRAVQVEMLRSAGSWTAADLHRNLTGDTGIRADSTKTPQESAPDEWEWIERLHRSARAELRLYQALALYRLGVRPGNARWPSDPCTLQPLQLERTPEGAEVVITSPQWCPWFYGDCFGGVRDFRFQVRTGN